LIQLQQSGTDELDAMIFLATGLMPESALRMTPLLATSFVCVYTILSLS
jgi:hypothetical protein